MTNQERLAWAILSEGEKHDAFAPILAAMERLRSDIHATKAQADNMNRFGAGHTRDPLMVRQNIVPALKHLAKVTAFIAKQMEERVSSPE